MIRKLGTTDGCPKCDTIRRGIESARTHPQSRRRRISQRIEDDEEYKGRKERAEERANRYCAEKSGEKTRTQKPRIKRRRSRKKDTRMTRNSLYRNEQDFMRRKAGYMRRGKAAAAARTDKDEETTRKEEGRTKEEKIRRKEVKLWKDNRITRPRKDKGIRPKAQGPKR